MRALPLLTLALVSTCAPRAPMVVGVDEQTDALQLAAFLGEGTAPLPACVSVTL